MSKTPITMTPGDETHLTLLMSPVSLNFVTGQDREHLLAFGRAAFEAGQKCQGCVVQQGYVPVDVLASDIKEPMSRFCPECGHVGEVGAGHSDCCPDGSHAFMVPARWANELREGFKARFCKPQVQLAAVQQAVPAQVVQLTLNGYQLLDALRLANPSLDFAPMELLTDIVLSAAPLVDFDGQQLHEGPIAWVDGVDESAIALEAEHETDLCAASHPAQQGLDAREFPAMTPELASILGLMCFQCISFAQALRAGGQKIDTRAEDEQAAVLHWMLGHYFRHGEAWRDAAAEDMERMKADAIAVQAKRGDQA